jgi:hypothetical protein
MEKYVLKRHIVHKYNTTTEKIKMKNKHTVVSKSSGRMSMPKQQSEKADRRFERLITEAGSSKKATDEILKWYTNSK